MDEQTICFRMLEWAARNGEPCPTNAQIAFMIGKRSMSTAAAYVNQLETAGLIAVERGSCARVVTIVASGKKTAGEKPAPHWREGKQKPEGKAPAPKSIDGELVGYRPPPTNYEQRRDRTAALEAYKQEQERIESQRRHVAPCARCGVRADYHKSMGCKNYAEAVAA